MHCTKYNSNRIESALGSWHCRGGGGNVCTAEVEAMCIVRNTVLIGLNRYCGAGTIVET